MTAPTPLELGQICEHCYLPRDPDPFDYGEHDSGFGELCECERSIETERVLAHARDGREAIGEDELLLMETG